MDYFRRRGKKDGGYLEIEEARTNPSGSTYGKITQRLKQRDDALKWQGLLGWGMYIVAAVLLLNLLLLIYSSTAHLPGAPAPQGYAPIFRGSCKTAGRITTVFHLVINVLSTLLLAVGTAAMQALSAPTRAELDQAHLRGKWLEIGVPSARNLFSISKFRVLLYIVLGLSSLPLHLYYNSVVFESVGTTDVLNLLATSGADAGKSWNDTTKARFAQDIKEEGLVCSSGVGTDLFNTTLSRFSACKQDAQPASLPDITAALTDIQNGLRNKTLLRRPAQDCAALFSGELNRDVNAVVLVSNLTGSDDTVILGYQWTRSFDLPPWVQQYQLGEKVYRGSFDQLGRNGTRKFDQISPMANIDHCLTQEASPSCSVQVAQTMLGVVIYHNIIKLLIIVYVTRFLRFKPLLTKGDAVVGYMESPDQTTVNKGPATAADFSRRHKSGPAAGSDVPWPATKRRWFAAVSKSSWGLLFTICALPLTIFAILTFTPQHLFGTMYSNNFDDRSWDTGFGEISLKTTISNFASTATAVWFANVPQLMLSYINIVHDGVMTSMLSAAEFADFSRERKGMRVSTPAHGDQRGTYRLGLPLRYALALKGAMALLHWLASESLFLVAVDRYSIAGAMQQPAVLATVGYSLRAAAAAIVLGLAIASVPFLLAFRALPPGIPLVRSCSLAISAACHPVGSEPADVAAKRLMYGVLPEQGPSGRRKVGFSARDDVEPLVQGEIYEQSGRAELSRHFQQKVGYELQPVPAFRMAGGG